jgi:small lipoprotein (TIGR04454 family)
MRHAPITVVCASLLLLLGACSDGKATEAECGQFSAHFESLMAGGRGSPEAGKTAKLAKDMARELHDRCLSEGTSAEVRCALAAESMPALQSCSDPK